MKYVKLIIRITIAIILIQTLRFKFTAHPDSVYIFSQVGIEPFGRIGIGILELIASVLILVPASSSPRSIPPYPLHSEMTVGNSSVISTLRRL